MSLKIYLLGQFKLQANDHPIELPSRPAQSLLAYLVLNVGVRHRRERLASLLWPDSTETNARGYLRQALWRIRKSLKSGSLLWNDYLQISDINVTFDDQSDYWLDADRLLEPLEDASVGEVIAIARLYRGELLPGFYDEWIVLERDRLLAAYHQKMNMLLERLVQSRQWEDALEWSEEWIRLGYAPEPAFRALMSAHAGLGDQGMVSATYRRCVEALNRELDLEPSPETQRLYERLLSGEMDGLVSVPPPLADLADQRPAFLDEGEPEHVEKPIFVAREHEIGQLSSFLELAFTGQGRVIFITGEAGGGKTALIQEFTRRALDAHADLVVASGTCNAHTGIGDPYLPFREVLEMLTGDVEAKWAAGAMTKEQARLLWNTLPVAARALVEVGPDLIDTFIPRAALVERARNHKPGGANSLALLEGLVDRKAAVSFFPNPQQNDLFEQYTRVLQSVAQWKPLLLVLDDLQWADLGSISLLFHLGRHLAGSRVLILGAYRPEEVALGRDGGRHALEPVVNEFQRQFGDITVNLTQAESQGFVHALLDSELNRLGEAFREMLYRQTRGHPLFTIELLRGMQERGGLVQDPEGYWVEGSALNWESMPARVEAVIAERISRLPPPLRGALRVASVEGEIFTAEVVASVRALEARELLGRLSGELDRRHRLIRAESIVRVDGQLLSRYRFRHILFHKYLYSSLDEVERVHLHDQVGTALEGLFGAQEETGAGADIALQLARHFQEARRTEKAVHYLHQAGERAVRLSAYQEGIAHLYRGLDLLTTLPDSPERAQQELTLQLSLGMAWMDTMAPEREKAYVRALELCSQLGHTSQLSQILGLGGLLTCYYVQADHQKARELGEEALSLARQHGDPVAELLINWLLGIVLFSLGNYKKAHDHLKQVLSFYDPHQHHHPLISFRGVDAGLGAMAYDACCLWCLGYPEQAFERSQEAITLSRRFNHAFTLADVLCYGGCLFNEMRQDPLALKDNAEELLRLSKELGFRAWIGSGTSYRGVALILLGEIEEGITQLRAGMKIRESRGARCQLPGLLGALAKAQSEIGQLDEGLTTLVEALSLVEETGERHWEAEVNRLLGEFHILQGDEAEAEAHFHTAIEVARQQCARSWELRATTSLARLWHKQGRTDEARDVLGAIYSWFTEGFDTKDLKEARALLDDFSD